MMNISDLAGRYMRICALAAEILRGARELSEVFPSKDIQGYTRLRCDHPSRGVDDLPPYDGRQNLEGHPPVPYSEEYLPPPQMGDHDVPEDSPPAFSLPEESSPDPQVTSVNTPGSPPPESPISPPHGNGNNDTPPVFFPSPRRFGRSHRDVPLPLIIIPSPVLGDGPSAMPSPPLFVFPSPEFGGGLPTGSLPPFHPSPSPGLGGESLGGFPFFLQNAGGNNAAPLPIATPSPRPLVLGQIPLPIRPLSPPLNRPLSTSPSRPMSPSPSRPMSPSSSRPVSPSLGCPMSPLPNHLMSPPSRPMSPGLDGRKSGIAGFIERGSLKIQKSACFFFFCIIFW